MPKLSKSASKKNYELNIDLTSNDLYKVVKIVFEKIPLAS